MYVTLLLFTVSGTYKAKLSFISAKLIRASRHVREDGRAATISFLWQVRKLSLRVTEHLTKVTELAAVRGTVSLTLYLSCTHNLGEGFLIQR